MFRRNLLIISILALLLLPTFVYAIDVPGWPLVPCGLSQDRPETPDIYEAKSCGRCDLFQLLKNVVDFVIGGLMPPVAVLLFVWAGFLILLSGANPGLYAQGQTIFKNTFYGIIILLSAWMITNTLILSVGAKYNTASNWWEFVCVEPAPVGPPVVTKPPTVPDTCKQPTTLAQQNNVPYPKKNAPELDTLISCVNSKIRGLIDQNQLFTYERTNDLCNYTRGQNTCGTCAHTVYSCHYGGRDGNQGSLAVDFNAKNGDEVALYNELLKLQSVCNFGFLQLETTHTHVSTQSCPGN